MTTKFNTTEARALVERPSPRACSPHISPILDREMKHIAGRWFNSLGVPECR